jgi:hypothetical protein
MGNFLLGIDPFCFGAGRAAVAGNRNPDVADAWVILQFFEQNGML